MTTFVSLFRGINVGGHHAVRMDELKALHLELGLQDVISYIQSGNVVFTSEVADAATLPRQIEESFAQKFDFPVKVVVRTADELHAIVANNPFPTQALQEPKRVVVLFLTTRPESRALEEFRQGYGGPEELCLIGQDLYMHYPDGIGRSKLSLPALEKKLKTSGTARNWSTVLQLQKLMQR